MVEHIHDVIDDDLHFKIDPDTRRVYRTSENPIVLVQHDHNSERLSFEIPKEIDGHDMTLCDKVRIHFLNFDAINTDDKFAGVYESTDLGILEEDDETLLFTWLVHMDSTGYAGPLNFAISFVCLEEKTEEDGSTSIVSTYSWNTLPNTDDIVVSGGMNHSQNLQDDYYDVIDTWIQTINNMGEIEKAEITEHTEKSVLSAKKSIEIASTQAVASIDIATTDAKQSIDAHAELVKENLGKKTLAEMGVMAQETGTATDKVMSQDATTKAVEAAKTFATSEATEVRSDFNGRCADIEALINETIPKLATYVKRPLGSGGRSFTPELGKLYWIEHKYKEIQDSPNAWPGVNNITITYNGTATFSGTFDAKFNFRELATPFYVFPDFRPGSKDENGFYFRLCEMSFTGANLEDCEGCKQLPANHVHVIPRVSFEVNGEYKVITYPGHDIGKAPSINDMSFTFSDGHRMLLGDVANAYEIVEAPNGSTFTAVVNANGISDITKTGTSGLTDTYTIVLDDGTTKTFTVKNGAEGNPGGITGASETQITAKDRNDVAITPLNLDHAVKQSTIQKMTDNREADLASVQVSSTFGPDTGPDPEHLPVGYDAIKAYIASKIVKPKVKCIILPPDGQFLLEPDHCYFVHGYGDNCLRVFYAHNGTNALPEVTTVDDFQAMITSTGDGTDHWQMFFCYIKDTSVAWKPTKWQHFLGPQTYVVNCHATGSAYIYDYGCP